jgi:hypothetical protein
LFRDFQEDGPHYLGSDGFAGCFGILIWNNKGAIVEHYVAAPTELELARRGLKELWGVHGDTLAGARAFVYAEVKFPEVDMFEDEWMKDEYVKLVKDITGIDAEVKAYVQQDPLLYDENYDLIEGWKAIELPAGFVLRNAGGGSAPTELWVVNPRWQTPHKTWIDDSPVV